VGSKVDLKPQVLNEEAKSKLKRLLSVIYEGLRMSYSIIMPIFTVITRMFTLRSDRFYRFRHRLNFKASPNVFLEQVAELTKMHEIDIYSFTNHSHGIFSTTLDSGSVAELRGRHLKIDVSDLNQGIFLIGKDGKEYRVSVYVTNMNTKQIFQIPDGLNAGDYVLELRAFLNHGKLMQKKGMTKILTVN